MVTLSECRPTNVSLPAALLQEAEALGINLSSACESGVAAAIKAERGRLWKLENKEAFEEYDRWIEEHGLPLDEFRTF